MRRVLVPSLTLLALAGAVAVAAPSAGPSGRPKPVASVAEFEKECVRAEERIARLLQRAGISREHEKVREYRSYTPTRLGDVNDRVRAKDLFEIIKDKDVPNDVRAEAAEALQFETAKLNDPDLSLEGKGLRRPRADFSVDVVQNLGNTDDPTITIRGLSNAILNGFWPAAAAREVDIAKYDPRKKDTWQAARNAWMRYLKK